MCEVTFCVKVETVPGDKVFVVGSKEVIGCWSPQNSKVELVTDGGTYPWWSGTGQFMYGELEFKFVVACKHGRHRWEERIENRVLAVSSDCLQVEAEFNSCTCRVKNVVGASEKRHAHDASPALAPALAALPATAPVATPALSPALPPVPALPAWTTQSKDAQSSPVHKKSPPPESPLLRFVPPPRSGDAAAGPGLPLVEHIAAEDQKRASWRSKLDLSRSLLEDGRVNSLSDLACLQAYLTWVSSGQIKCQEDGRHFRPCAHADASRKITALLWQLASRSDAERFIARRVFPCLPSYADQFSCAVPMTRIRDIAHRNDIPRELKEEIKHTLQNKLHRCADPGDLITCHKLIERVRKENCYSPAFVKEFEIFYVELKEFFNAGGLDEQANQVANGEASLRPIVDRFLELKGKGADAAEQLLALTELRRAAAPRAEAEQPFLLLDLEVEKYAFVLLSQLAGSLENVEQGSGTWWQRLVHVLQIALMQSALSGLAGDECRVVSEELSAIGLQEGNATMSTFSSLRLAASADRALRICFQLTQQLEEAHSCVPLLGRVLNIDAHAVAVFVEAEVRTSIQFQISKLAQLVMQQAKRNAGLPLWTAISTGSAVGRCVRCRSLAEAWTKTLPPEGAVLLCNEASGDEELPPLCRGVVVGRDLPVLSHLALRARQTGAAFGCTAEPPLFESLLASIVEGAPVRLFVEAMGAVRLEHVDASTLNASAPPGMPAKGEEETQDKQPSGKPKLGALDLSAMDVIPAAKLAGFPQTAGSKAASSGRLEGISSIAGFKVPLGLAVPFGIMAKAVSGSAVEEAVEALEQALLGQDSAKVEECAASLRAIVKKCRVPASVLESLMAGFPAGTMRVAVRSSANSEDLEGISGAGLHDSVLGVNVSDSAELEQAVLQVWSSMFTLRAVQSRSAAKMPLYRGVAMGVLVQPMVSLAGRAYAFIAFSKHVVERDADAVYLEFCVGLGETIASASEPGTPYRLVVQKSVPHAVRVLSLGSFSFGLQDAVGGPVAIQINYSKERLSTDQAFLETLAREVASVATKVEESYGLPMDLEGVVLERENSREVHLVQARPIVEG